MAAPIKLNLKVYQGSTFNQVFRWESNTKVYPLITSITKAAPMVITAPAHGVTVGWRVKPTNVGGMKELNTGEYLTVTGVTTDTVTFNSVNSLAYTTFTSGGVLEYNSPIDLSNLTGRLQVRETVTSDVVLVELTTANNLIQINNIAKTITITIPAGTTQNLDFKKAVYNLELVRGDVVIPFSYGSVSLVTEATR
jgi:hypothetical protein